jgi:hypothetical protein
MRHKKEKMEKPDNGQSADPVFADPGLLNTAGRR